MLVVPITMFQVKGRLFLWCGEGSVIADEGGRNPNNEVTAPNCYTPAYSGKYYESR